MNTASIVINATKEVAEAIRQEIEAKPGSQSRLSERKNLNGDVAAWIVIATLGVNALPTVLDFIKGRLQTRCVTKIKIGDWEVENPTREMIEEFMARSHGSGKSKKTKGD